MDCFKLAMMTYELVLPANIKTRHRRYQGCIERVELYRSERYRL
jgi:hypothetical protein